MLYSLDSIRRSILLCKIVVFIRGHTNNDADHLFNSFKGGYHHRDILTY